MINSETEKWTTDERSRNKIYGKDFRL